MSGFVRGVRGHASRAMARKDLKERKPAATDAAINGPGVGLTQYRTGVRKLFQKRMALRQPT